jgi:tetratricopeptide (TPR) repeat protein
MKAGTIFWGIAILFLSFAIAVTAKAQTATAAFRQAVADYQAVQDDETTEKVIKMAAAMRVLPPIPEEARKHFVRGAAMFKGAQSADAYRSAIDEFREAVHLAPWWPEARYNCALAFEAAGDYDNAIYHLKFYLLFKLPAADARAAQDKIYALEFKQEEAAKAKAASDAEAAIAATEKRQRAQAADVEQERAQKQKNFEELLRRINGRKYYFDISAEEVRSSVMLTFIQVRGKTLVYMRYVPPYMYDPNKHKNVVNPLTLDRSSPLLPGYSDMLSVGITGWASKDSSGDDTFTINEDGSAITIHSPNSTGTYHWAPGTAPF